MIHPDLIVNRSLFGDALDGEFFPPTDGDKKAHRLLRLAHRAVHQGKLVEADRESAIFEYTPPWAITALATITCSRNFDTDEHLIGGVYLRDTREAGDEPDLSVINGIIPGRGASGLILIEGTDTAREYALELGGPVDVARQNVTKAAESFFKSLVTL